MAARKKKPKEPEQPPLPRTRLTDVEAVLGELCERVARIIEVMRTVDLALDSLSNTACVSGALLFAAIHPLEKIRDDLSNMEVWSEI